MGTADGLRSRFRQTQVPDLSFAHEVGHRSHSVFDGRVGVDAMLVVEVDRIDAQSLQARFAGLAHIGG